MPPPPGAVPAPTAAIPGPATPLVAPSAAVPGAATVAGTSAAAVVTAGLISTPGAAGVVTGTPKSLDATVLFAREQYVYTSGNRRDPFLSLLDARFQSPSRAGSLADRGAIHLRRTGWGASDK